MNKITFRELCKEFNEINDNNGKSKRAVIVFTPDSFTKEYTEIERSYEVSSDNKFFDSTKIGNSLFGNCLDGIDNGVRLDWYMQGIDAWKVEYCYIKEVE